MQLIPSMVSLLSDTDQTGQYSCDITRTLLRRAYSTIPDTQGSGARVKLQQEWYEFLSKIQVLPSSEHYNSQRLI